MHFLKLFNRNVKQININMLIQRRFFKNVRFEDIPEVSVTTIRARLKQNKMQFEELHTNLMIGCPICEKNGDSLVSKTKVFINKRTGAFTCESCKHTGSWLNLDSYISAKKLKHKVCKESVIVKELDSLNSYLKTTKANTIAIEELDQKIFKQLLIKFNLPESIAQHTLQSLGIRIDITHTELYIPLLNSALDLVGFKVVNMTRNSTSIEPKLANTLSSGVIINKQSKSKNVLIVACIVEFFILVQAQISYNLICLPNGLSYLSQHILPCFEKYTKLILWFGNDITSLEIARSFSKKFGEKRCHFVRSVDKTAADQDFKTILASAQPFWHKSITTFSSLRQDVLADLQNVDKVQGVKWTRYPGLNRLLKGHRRGELTVFTGPTGSGKTTFISEYSLDLAMQGVNTLWGSFEIRNARLARTMLQQMSGIPLDENLDKYDFWADQFEILPIYYMTFHGQQSIKIVMEAIEHAVYVHDISHVIIDNLQFMMGMSEDTRNMDRFWKQDLIVANFRTFATRRNCHVTLVIHPRKERDAEDLTTSSIFGGAKASQEADNILIIQDKRLASIKGRKYLQVSKNRYSGDLGIIPLEFDKASLSFAPKKRKTDDKKDRDDMI